MKFDLVVTLAILGIVGFFLYKVSQVFGSGGGEYCNNNPSAFMCQLFGGGPGTGGTGKACIGLGCTGALWCSYFPSTCSSTTPSNSGAASGNAPSSFSTGVDSALAFVEG